MSNKWIKIPSTPLADGWEGRAVAGEPSPMREGVFGIEGAVERLAQAQSLEHHARIEHLAAAVLSRHPDPLQVTLVMVTNSHGGSMCWFEPLSTEVVNTRVAALNEQVAALRAEADALAAQLALALDELSLARATSDSLEAELLEAQQTIDHHHNLSRGDA